MISDLNDEVFHAKGEAFDLRMQNEQLEAEIGTLLDINDMYKQDISGLEAVVA